jgi:outer membrane protein assembly factor BamA
MPRALRGFIGPLWLAAAALAPASALGQGASSGALTIGEIRVTGQNRLRTDRVEAAIGLKAGDLFLVKDLNRVAERLGRSGVFEEVSYMYTPHGSQVEVEFKVREVARFRKCAFDNFVWARDDELQERLQRDIPLYTGEAPESGEVLEEMSRDLEELSRERGVLVHVERLQQGSLGAANWIHLFIAQGLHITMQAVSFSGALTVNPKELDREVAELIGKPYSAVRCRAFASAGLIPFYRERGYLRAGVEVEARIRSHSEGSDEFGVEVLFAITEGNVYRWASPEWQGNQRKSATELESLIGMKPGSVANGKKIDEGWEAVKRAYGKEGFIEANVTPEPVFDEAGRQVHYAVAITEGAQYRMGSFQATGMPQAVADRLKRKWKLTPGDVYDASYLGEFLKADAPSLLQGILTRSSRIKTTALPNREQQVVDVAFELQ